MKLLALCLFPFCLAAAPATLELAKTYMADQNQEMAFKTFLEALEQTPALPSKKVSAEEEALYQEALALYLGKRPQQARSVGYEIDEKYTPVLKAHPEYTRLGFIVAVADANLSRYDRFFDLFYRSYQQEPKHYLAWKTKAILHLKLMERAKTFGEREQQRKAVLDNLAIAESIYPQDFSLYRVQIAFSLPAVKKETQERILKKILDQSMIPSRTDTLYFIEQALTLDDKGLAKRWIESAKAWYPESRIINQLYEEYGTKDTR